MYLFLSNQELLLHKIVIIFCSYNVISLQFESVPVSNLFCWLEDLLREPTETRMIVGYCRNTARQVLES